MKNSAHGELVEPCELCALRVNSAFGFLFLLLGSAMLEPKKKGGQMPPPHR